MSKNLPICKYCHKVEVVHMYPSNDISYPSNRREDKLEPIVRYNVECCIDCHILGKDFKEEIKMQKEYAKKYNSW
jgi:hypothetical protein